MLSASSAMTFVVLLGTVSLFSDATYGGGAADFRRAAHNRTNSR